MKAGEIETQKDLQAWLEGQSQEVCVWIAARAAARKLPLYWSETALAAGQREESRTLLTLYRSLLTALTFANTTKDNIQGLLRSAATDVAIEAKATADVSVGVLSNASVDALFVAHAAAEAEAAPGGAGAVAKTRSFVDAQWSEVNGIATPIPLWVGGKAGIPPEIAAAWEATRAALTARIEAGETGWQFWLDWYEAQLTGADQNWEMLKEIVLIPDADWQQGAAHVNGLIEEIVEKYRHTARSDLSQAFPVDFSFDSLQRVMRMVGIQDDMAHLRDPAVVQSFLDDCDELRDTLRDFSDYAQAAKAGSNKIAMLHLSANKVLAELQRTRDTDHLRARHIVRLAGRLEAFSKEEVARADMGEALGDILDDGIGLLRTVTRRHFGSAYTALAPLGQLTLDHVDQEEVVALFDRMIAQMEALPSDELVALDEDGLNVFRDMIRELHEFRAAIAEASSDAFREVLEQRFAESIGGMGLAFGRFMEMSSSAAGKGGRALDGAVKTYKRVQGIGDIIEFIRESLNLGSLP
ncbi:hypothetical protein [Salibaculum halophilum]|uniref:hypothetical protein n=1 Tax=Salibaculum halophilum TaxID=1914408 RepID=UPI00117B5FED|nr:hypothetical protein [Salibaculum halophilum]